MGRTRKLRLKGGQYKCPGMTNEQYAMMQYHLYADMKHDHGAGIYVELPAAITLINEDGLDVKGVDSGEIGMYNNILAKYPAQNSAARQANIIRFKLDNQTSLLPGKDIFTPFKDTPNEQVGVLQDAGFLLYEVIGATNLITYGSILDQAGKPRNNAFYFNVGADKTISIPSCMLGFNSARLTNIEISGFTGSSVKCEYSYKYQTNALKKGGTPPTGLTLNSLGGDFQSNTTVKRANKDAKFPLLIGKALGDALQVVSIMPNLFLPLGSTAVPLDGKGTPRPVMRAIMNTGDRLNHARAFAFGVGSVFAPPSKNGVYECEYIPGNDTEITLSDMFTLYTKRIFELIVKSDLAYEQLMLHLSQLSTTFVSNFSIKSGQPLITLQTGIVRAGFILKGISLIVDAIRTYVMAYFEMTMKGIETFTPETATPEVVNRLKNTYEKFLTEANGLLPSHTSTMKSKGEQANLIEAITICKFKGQLPGSDITLTTDHKKAVDDYMKTIRPGRISNPDPLPPTTIVGGIKGTIVFYISNIYQLLGKNAKIGSPYSKIFEIVKFEGIDPSGLLGPVGSVDEARQIGQIFGQNFVKSTQLPVTGGGGMIGGQEEMDEPQNDALILFKEYADHHKQSWNTILTNAFATSLKNPFSIVDDVLFNELYGSTIAYYGEPAENAFNGVKEAVKTLVLMRAERPGPVTRSMTAAKIENYNVHTYASLFVNEFSMWYNASIVRDIGVEDNDYYDVLMAYSQEFKALREGADNIMYFFENPVAGGQRVDRAYPYIDETKSFVKSVGVSPSVVDK